MTRSDEFLARLADEFPGFRVVYKDQSGFSRLIDIALKLVTFGAQSEYLTRFHTVIGDTLYVPRSWQRMEEVDRVILLRHERVHLLQRRRWGLPLMTFLYLIPLFPLGLAYGRARIEWEAYAETLRATAELRGLDEARSPALRRHIVQRFVDGSYGWMWPFRRSVERWYDAVLRELEGNREVRHDPEASDSTAPRDSSS